MTKKNRYWVYILEVANGNFYTGYTNNLSRRYKEHLAGTKQCKYTRSFKPQKIAASWLIQETQGLAMKIESFIKRLAKKDKILLTENPAILKKRIKNKLQLNLNIKKYTPNKEELLAAYLKS